MSSVAGSTGDLQVVASTCLCWDGLSVESGSRRPERTSGWVELFDPRMVDEGRVSQLEHRCIYVALLQAEAAAAAALRESRHFDFFMELFIQRHIVQRGDRLKMEKLINERW